VERIKISIFPDSHCSSFRTEVLQVISVKSTRQKFKSSALGITNLVKILHRFLGVFLVT